MSLRSSLGAIRTLADLPNLARELGLTPIWHEVAIEAAPLPTASPGLRSAVVGQRGRFFSLGLEGPCAPMEARRLARALTQRGQVALVLGLEADRRLLAVAIAYGNCPALSIALDHADPMDLRRLERARAPGDGEETSGGLGGRWAEALSGRELGGRFFRQFRRTLETFVGALPGHIPRRHRHGLALLALTRVLFLYFVQEKGWLDGRRRFLRDELDRSLREQRGVEVGFLRPLFFGTLNRPWRERSVVARGFGRVPFLNGGLFEVHPLERRWSAPLPDTLWRDAFDELFERYHFTVGERPRVEEGTIGPDMLGRVFEGVLDPEERRSRGVFYTPARLVDELAGAALAEWLAGRLGVSSEEAIRLLAVPSAAAIDALRSVTVLDPAAGSGAFLLGTLRLLVGARISAGEQRAGATRTVLATNLFGVDRNPHAVRLAELRLWLEVVEADTAEDPTAVAPLPNLDSFVRQGDSLTEPFHAPVVLGPEDGARLHRLRAALVGATGSGKRRLVAALRQAELGATRHALDRAVAGVEARLQDLVDAARSPSLFGGLGDLPRRTRRSMAVLRRDRARLRDLSRRLGEAEELPWFHYRLQFGDVTARGGFDVVLGNPPWVRGESLSRSDRRQLKATYRWFRGGAGPSRGYAHLPDLSTAFLERGFDLLNPTGILAMLVPAKLLTAGYATTLRAEVSRRATLLVAEDLTERTRGAFEATVYPLALVARRGAAAAGHRVRLRLAPSAPSGPTQETLGGAPWVLRGDRVTTALERLTLTGPPLGSRYRVQLGVKTGCDRAFLDPGPGVEAHLLRPAVRGRDLAAFRVTSCHQLLWTHDQAGVVLDRLPPGAREHLAPFEVVLRRRADYRRGPYWALFRAGAAQGPVRLVWADLARDLEVAVLHGSEMGRVVPLNTTYVIRLSELGPALRLAVWLNTTWVRAFARHRASVAAAGFARFNSAVVASVPVPAAALSDRTLHHLGQQAWADGRLDQAAADDHAATMLALSPDERDALRVLV